MRRHLPVSVVLIFVGVAVKACGLYVEHKTLHWLETTTAAVEFEKDRRSGRLRLYLVCGDGCWPPGPRPRALQSCNDTIEFTRIDGTSDLVLSETQKRLNERASEFAYDYNRQMIAHVEQKTGRAVRDCMGL